MNLREWFAAPKVARAPQIEALALRFENTLSELIGSRSVVGIFDFPNHSNVGDSAIYLGELEALGRIGVDLKNIGVYDLNDSFVDISRLGVCGDVVLIHGGGNFGDLYPRHQDLRVRLLNQLKRFRVIQLPQSIAFSTSEKLSSTSEAISGHPDFHLMVRDLESEIFAKQSFDCKIYLVPDAALSLRGIPSANIETSFSEIYLFRTDKEKNNLIHIDMDLPPNAVIEDWLEEPWSAIMKFEGLIKKVSNPYPSIFEWRLLKRLRFEVYKRIALERLTRGQVQLSRARKITTDRLHGYIIALLMGIPNETLDNSTGKIKAFRSTWKI